MHFTFEHEHFRIIKNVDEDDSTTNLLMELEEATKMADEVNNPAEAIDTDEVTNDGLLKLPSSKVSVFIIDAVSTCVD